MAMISHRLRRALLTATSSLNRSVSISPASSAPAADFPFVSTLVQRSVLRRLTSVSRAPVRLFSTRQYKLYKEGDEITEDTVLFEGCDFNHWLITMDFPKDNPLSPEEMVSTYEQTCAAGLGISWTVRQERSIDLQALSRIRITDCYFLHFTTQGIKVQGGHETYISNTFLGQHSTVGGDKQERQFSGTGIDISSTDNAITDVVIFSAGIGILLNGQANMVTGVHCYNKATWFGGIGILVKSHLTRIDNCYLDYTGIVIEDPVHVHVTNALFLGDANIVLRSVHGRINGVNIVNNMFSGDPKHNFPMVKLEGEFHEVDQVVIDQNNVEGMVMKSTTGRSKVSGNGTRWVADFSSVLVFPNRIDHYQHSFFAQSGQIPASAVTNVSYNVVVVETDRAVTGTVSVIVYQ
ncbi:hypothetical protein F2Q70_00032823 [Brassica cretica]|uniref:MORF/ORRM1/DAG-like MORF domain-containing protein n=1 Tax=Brassica cretica TaxID=69181 RepID=A0A8S9FNZ2_BRACR|nr:hypothetical protein F2Q70_00032823 [Brassica cretica]